MILQSAVRTALEYVLSAFARQGKIESEYTLHLLQSASTCLGLTLEEAELVYANVPIDEVCSLSMHRLTSL